MFQTTLRGPPVLKGHSDHVVLDSACHTGGCAIESHRSRHTESPGGVPRRRFIAVISPTRRGMLLDPTTDRLHAFYTGSARFSNSGWQPGVPVELVPACHAGGRGFESSCPRDRMVIENRRLSVRSRDRPFLSVLATSGRHRAAGRPSALAATATVVRLALGR